jgi:hypothetical protein
MLPSSESQLELKSLHGFPFILLSCTVFIAFNAELILNVEKKSLSMPAVYAGSELFSDFKVAMYNKYLLCKF